VRLEVAYKSAFGRKYNGFMDFKGTAKIKATRYASCYWWVANVWAVVAFGEECNKRE